ncbi:30S ribosomal protein S4 [Candidatus Uhrbacteria bacterium CG_4_10_14_0_2_um_filter_41_7]|uniref:Small ribosomal subunit protein uS4 n=1 Tax=Candidatus Uhrbacteria bacterium CG_4_9_14_3_um_filter_41_35 TaxID=1975034 RepID=A0A2M7XFD9_9BACT|nr:MAG: 30S ribosomal protein S4 [Candidatus Uhrbacteria bacterium CG11_big_fil_rev_8_21_14_0_20_41_9]PIZ55571.1 MAG: 30S ribosomal protein S4 [Candidatus Uhrbacteria bacterium CG_4_10_14_0_2_um_filter_41_7]PJA46578.1 MAG: 30S ribosomal protein S4 [Candidatus Uhrbacteria bacterium CG_4_9_14_3_um_filter_41_35]
MGKTLKKMGKMSRREGVALSTGDKVLKIMQRRPSAPGQHGGNSGKRPARLSVYGIQLREKQKAKRLYGLLEKQFRNYFTKASRMEGNTAENLPRLLEMRLDNTVYRLGFAKTRPQARQLVSHALFCVNGQKVNIPSYTVKVDDVITIRPNKVLKPIFNELDDRLKNQTVPGWLHLDLGTKEGKVVSLPEGEDLKEVYDPKLIIEFYSR